jgi:pimeloyl-ACP methyl ester carboxylesterase
LQKPLRHNSLRSNSKQLVSVVCIFFFTLVFSSFSNLRVKRVTFHASDGLEITADEYILAPDKPYILLFHEQGSSRGEFSTIAHRLNKLDYNCLAVDLRNGGNYNYVSNETAKGLREKNLEAGMKNIELDMIAAISYAREKSKLPVVLFGSGANGSLSLKIAVADSAVRAVVALSPGEYFMNEIKIQDAISTLQKPVFITSSKAELPYVTELVSDMDPEFVTLYKPKQGDGDRGSRSFSVDYEYNSEYWMALMLFFKDLM